MSELKLSDFQKRVMCIPEEYDVFLGGGRGGAKSYGMTLIALRHAEQYQSKARILYIRQSYKGVADFENLSREVFGLVYGQAARYNAQEHIWRLPGGAYMELGQLETAADYSKYQGRSFTLLFIDEAGHYSDPVLLDRLRSNLRGPKNMPIRMIMAANPGDPGHAWLAQRYVFKGAAPWVPFHEEKSKRHWVYAPSTFLDNPFIDQEEYKAQLEASCPTDPELLRAWLEGDWTIARGAFFSSVIEEKRNATDPWQDKPPARGYDDWEYFLAHDFGVSAPSVTYVAAKSPGVEGPDGRYYPKDSLVLIDELATNEPGSLSKGMGYTIPILSEEIKDMCNRWEIKPRGVADDACFSNQGSGAGSISDEFRKNGVYFTRAKKGDRRAGWEIMRRMLQDAGKPDKPGLYVARNCEYFWQTVPYLGRDPRKADDVDTRGPDHGADACRYGCLYQKPIITTSNAW
ncbi:MAG TPA: phage terminase large subunit [Geobacteraceae bacterium]|nr:phage terminase large subunit [Geobacteraceae bacterium]